MGNYAKNLAEMRDSKKATKLIRLRKQHPKTARAIEESFGLSSVAACVLAARGFQADDATKVYLTPTLREGLPDPKGLKNLDAACQLIKQVIDAGNSIAICCDFDVDGLCGGSILHHFLTAAGVESEVFVPDRFADGYGLNEAAVRKIAGKGFGLMIAVDFGTTNFKELHLAAELNLKTLVIDHHHVGKELPPATVFINPHQQGCSFADATLCAAGLVWYLLIGLKKSLPQAAKTDVKSYLDLACLATICDMVPLLGANRVIAKRGLEVLTATRRAGLCALKNIIGINGDVSCTNVGFGIGPRINAAGRIVHGELVVEMLTTENSSLARRRAERLNRLNLQRQDIESQIKSQAVAQVEAQNELPWGIVVWDGSFHTGVIGIVAQRLAETFYRPAIVIGADEGVFKGSVRGIKGFSVIESLTALESFLLRFGGHEGAGGFSIKEENLPGFSEAFNSFCQERLSKLETSPYCEADVKVKLSDITINLIRELESFGPFGIGNPAPTLLLANLEVLDIRVLKDTHLKVSFSDGKRGITGLMWQTVNHPALSIGTRVNVAGRPNVNVFNGLADIQLNIQAVETA